MKSNKFALRDYYVTIAGKNLHTLHTNGAWLYDGCTTEQEAERAAFAALCREAAAIGVEVTCDHATLDDRCTKLCEENWRNDNILGIPNTINNYPHAARTEHRTLCGNHDFH